MKRSNGKNIILSSDITIEEGGVNTGKNLNEVLKKQSSELEELKSNIKWIYKYGGVGSGKGGGPGISTSWSIYARLDGELINGNIIPLSGKGSYKLSIRISNPAGGVFNVTYKYGSATGKTVTLNQDNVWTLETTIPLDSNSKITIDVIDGNAEIKSVEANYIAIPYEINYKLINNNGVEYTDPTIFMNDIRTGGLKVRISYSIIDSIDSFELQYVPLDSTEIKKENIELTGQEHSGYIDLPVFNDLENNLSNDFIGDFLLKIDFIILGRTINYEKSITILPDGLYLRVKPIEGRVYNEDTYNDVNENSELLEDIYKYYVGTVSFNLTAFSGITNNSYNIEYSMYVKAEDDETWELQEKSYIKERNSIRSTLRFSKSGWNIIHVHAEVNGREYDNYIYLYTKDFDSSLNWYPENLINQQINSNVFRVGITTQEDAGFSINNKKILNSISMSINSSPVEVIPKNIPAISQDCLICVGIQYNSTSNSNEPILIFSAGNNSEDTDIKIYQNKVLFGNNDREIYLGTELDNYDITQGENYHLISIYRRFIFAKENNKYFELCVYIDGVLETAFPQYIRNNVTYSKITLCPNNYFINTLELSYFPHLGDSDFLTDAGIVRYWYTYRERIQRNLSEEETENLTNLLTRFEDGVYLNGTHVSVSLDALNGIVNNSTVPVMMLTYDESYPEADGFFNWSEKRYDEDESSGEKIVGVKWNSGHSNLGDQPLPRVSYGSTQFSLSVQGSTTKIYSSKNYMLTLNWVSESDDHSNTVPLYSPNFDPTDNNTFLPEQAFTLKADVVDSGHSNNTCMGSFINKVTRKFEAAKRNESNEKYSGFIRNCLEGFPFLLFIEITKPSDVVEYYYLGIYNFNLGRNSYFNLGYSRVSNLPSESGMDTSTGFCFCTVREEDYKLKSGFTCAEISYNDNYYDFSSFHNTILFKQGSGDKTFMFDDIYHGYTNDSNGLTIAQDKIKLFVEHTAYAGGYVFEQIGKVLEEHEEPGSSWHRDGYTVPGQVPNYRQQCQKRITDTGVTYVPEEGFTKEANRNDLIYYVVGNRENEIDSYVDYQSLIEYYTICMAFGMIDSVQKNLTIKSWDGNKFYFAFYDMDTCLGIDNNAKNSTYYAFSDLWNQTTGNPQGGAYPLNGQVAISRDYFDKNTYPNIKGYDVPSNYAFAVAKYFQSVISAGIDNPEYENLGSPQSLWAKWRHSHSTSPGYNILPNVDTFMDKYYLGYMKNVNELMFNYNYRQKYLRPAENNFNSNNPGFNLADIEKFHGRRTEYIRDWLSGRFHIMDAYLNLTKTSVPLKPNSSNFPYYEQMPKDLEIDDGNEDIFVIRDIFSSGEESISDNLNFTVQAPDFSPLIIGRGSATLRYLLPDSDKRYKIFVENVGNNKITLGGSALWTYLDSIDSFIHPGMKINSTRLRSLTGTSGTVTTWDITMPALQTVELTSSNYAGTLNFDATTKDNFTNLSSINISNSSINLTVIKENVKTINLTRVGTNSKSSFPSVYISDCFNLENVTIKEAKLNSLFVSPVWSTNIDLSGNNIKILELSCDSNNPSALTISDNELTTLRLHHFSSITIKDCPKLESISIMGYNFTSLTMVSSNSDITPAPNLTELSIQDVSKLTSLSLRGCKKLSSLTLSGNPSKITSLNLNSTKIGIINYPSLNDYESDKLDLTPMTSLTSLNIGGNSAVEYVKLLNDPTKPVGVYASYSSSLKRIYGHIKIITSEALRNLPNFHIFNGNQWNGYTLSTIFDGYLVTPFEIMTGVTSLSVDSMTKEEKHTTISGRLSNLFERDNLTDTYDNYTNRSWFWYRGIGDTIDTGEVNIKNSTGITNITFGNTHDGISKANRKIEGNLLGSICAHTPISQYEIYYLLNAFAVSAARCDDGKVASQTLDYSFWYEGTGRFDGNNVPSRYMFYGCSKITSLGTYTINTNAGSTRLLSPESENGKYIDNGLFSPLTNLTKIGRFIDASKVYISKSLFRRGDEEKYPIASFDQFKTSVVIDEESAELSKNGDFTGFFNDIEPERGSLIINQSFSPQYLNFNTLNIPENISVTSVEGSFNPTSGYGIIDLKNIFTTKSSLVNIVNSFKVSTADEDYQNALNEDSETPINSEGKVLFPLTDDMFDGFSSLQYIGAKNDQYHSEYGSTIIKAEDSKYGSGTLTFGFTGAGLLKYIGQETFPYDIFVNLGNNLLTCSGFMSELTIYNGSFGADDETVFEFPGNSSLFRNNRNLEDVAAFLKNCRIKFKLTGEGFSECTKLQNISEIFYGNVGSGNVCSNLVGSIPPKLFYHGIKSNGSANIVYGIDNLPEGVEDINELNVNDYKNDEHKVTIPGKPTYNRNIKYAYAVFRGCAQLVPYECVIGEDFGKLNSENSIDGKDGCGNINPEYINKDYTCWKYIINGDSWKEGNTRPLDISSVFDGNKDNININLLEKVICEEDINTTVIANRTSIPNYSNLKDNTVNYFCPPDLLSYMDNSDLTNIQYMFSHCGRPPRVESTKMMTGRICPYLLKPIPEITHLSGMFKWCDGLSSVKFTEQGKNYLIPENFFTYAVKVNTLIAAFSGVYFEENISLDVFQRLRGYLDLRGIFAWCGYAGIPNISGVFAANKYEHISGAFSAYPISFSRGNNTDEVFIAPEDNSTHRSRLAIFRNNFSPIDTELSRNTYYVYRGHGDNAEDANIAQENNNY